MTVSILIKQRCPKCGTCKYYAHSGECVECRRIYQVAQNDQPQKLARKFEGEPCIKCGNTIRYRRSGGCVVCCNASAVRESKDHEIKKLKARIQSLESEVAELKKRLEGSEL